MILLSNLPQQRAEADPADVAEQQRPADPSDPAEQAGLDLPEGANEADVLEQRQDASIDDEDGREG